MTVREAGEAAAIGLTLSGVAPCLAVWALWSLFGEALLDAVFVAFVAGCVAVAVALARSLAREGGERDGEW
jgi:hypothetical protein